MIRAAILVLWILVALLLLFNARKAVAEMEKSVDDVLIQYMSPVEQRLLPRFSFADVSWPPEQVTLVAFKDTRLVELWALDEGDWKHIRDYRVKGMSGRFGPKLREGDRQVPEGLYRIEALNPNSAYHLSLKLNYPNEFDLEQARQDGREELGGDIFIHGGSASRGCIAVGDRAVEELFVLTALLGEDRVSVLITPRDYRFRPQLPPAEGQPEWVTWLNQKIATNLKLFPLELK